MSVLKSIVPRLVIIVIVEEEAGDELISLLYAVWFMLISLFTTVTKVLSFYCNFSDAKCHRT